MVTAAEGEGKALPCLSPCCNAVTAAQRRACTESSGVPAGSEAFSDVNHRPIVGVVYLVLGEDWVPEKVSGGAHVTASTKLQDRLSQIWFLT